MDVTKLTPATLRELANLSEAKQKLTSQIAEIDAKLTKIAAGQPVTKSPTKAAKGKPAASSAKTTTPGPKKSAPRGKRGALKANIIKLLQSAGPGGLAVKEICQKLGLKNQNVHVWFSSTGKKVAEIRRLDTGNYAFLHKAPAAAAAPTPTPVPVAPIHTPAPVVQVQQPEA